MHRYKRYLPVIAIVLIALGVNLDEFGIDLQRLAGQSNTANHTASSSSADAGSASGGFAHPGYEKWSTTEPNINLWHVFEGEINRSGKPVGFHSRPQGQDPANARVIRVRDSPNRAGVYTAQIEIRNDAGWQQKFSSFFPDSLSREAVLDVILNAYRNSDNPDAQPWDGPSGLGFRVQGYTSSRGGINTAFPVYVQSQ